MTSIHKVLSHHSDNAKILVLETDDPHPDTQEEKGSFGEILHELFHEAGETHEPKLGIETTIKYIVEDRGGRLPKASEIEDDVHAILITGSVYDAHGDEPWVLKLIELIKEIWTNRPDIRFTGICFGHQILCRTLGSTVEPEPNGEWELAHTPIELSRIGQRLFDVPESQDTIALHQMHLDHVVDPPDPAKTDLLPNDAKVHVWGKSEQTGVQGVYIQKRMFTSQGHMEFDSTMVKRQLEMRVDAGSLEDHEAEEAAERAEWMHDGLIVAQAVLRFFHGDDDEIQ